MRSLTKNLLLKNTLNKKLKLSPLSRIILKGLKTGNLRKASATLLNFNSRLLNEKLLLKNVFRISKNTYK